MSYGVIIKALELIFVFLTTNTLLFTKKQTVFKQKSLALSRYLALKNLTELMFDMAIYTEEAWTSLIQLT